MATTKKNETELQLKSVPAWDTMKVSEQKEAMEFAKDYMHFLDEAKTEREAVTFGIRLAENEGYVPYHFGMELKEGGKYYLNNRGKSLLLWDMGNLSAQNGVRLAIAHVDCPRLDIRQRPVCEENGIAYLKTHYYGGIKKYQWTTIPLALHGTVVRADGTQMDIRLGEEESDPVLYISDLLPHLGKEQMAKSLAEGITGEDLNLIAGHFGDKSAKKDAVRERLLQLLNEKYQITEADLTSAELCAVPATHARFVGLDRSLIAAYGHDDRVCAYPALTALLYSRNTAGPRMCVLADKEEIGSVGVSGLRSAVLRDVLDEIASACHVSSAALRSASTCLSADVTAGFDPTFASAFEKNNSAYLGHGIGVCKYTGARGKSGASDASAELMGKIRRLFDAHHVAWQTSELGKIDLGGGGTVAAYVADMNVEVLDVGVALLSMHAPVELASVADIYMTHRAFLAFYA